LKSVQKSLVAFDTDHIKEYVFGTDRLKEIRGASSLLDRLNRQEMERVANISPRIEVDPIYTNGGSGLFVVDEKDADEFGERVKWIYREMSGGRASVTVAVQNIPNSSEIPLAKLKECNLLHELDLVKYRLIEEKGSPPPTIALPSHPFMRHCSSCGVEYAEVESLEAEEAGTFYCASCRGKQKEDSDVKDRIPETISLLNSPNKSIKEIYLWDRMLWYLSQEHYDLSYPGLDRPEDFNEFRQFAEASKDYIGLIYADANNMGKMIEELEALEYREVFAKGVDDAVYRAIARAINKFLPVVTIEREKKLKQGKEKVPVFPFDILLVGGDDIVMVTDATKAMDVACEMAQQFRALANEVRTFEENGQIDERIRERISDLLKEGKMSLSISVVLAPVKYPFGLLQDMTESALKFAKKAAHDDRAKLKEEDRKQFDGSRINFFVVTGGSKPDFKDIYNDFYKRKDKGKEQEFHATLRPYTPEELQRLLSAIREGKSLGRTKLHQLREAVYDKSLSKSVMKALAALRSWNDTQRDYIVRRVVYGQSYEYRKQRYKMSDGDPQDLIATFPRVTFPWFYDGENKEEYEVYRTPLLDFIELYDFVAREGGNNGDRT
jgi:hypothetical protein